MSWRENGVIVRIAVLLVGTGMVLFGLRNRRKKGCQRIEGWMFLPVGAPVLPRYLEVTRKIHTTLGCISLPLI